MKLVKSALVATSLLLASNFAIAGGSDKGLQIDIYDVSVNQAQYSSDSSQELKVGTIADGVDGDVKIHIGQTSIYQYQESHNSYQTAHIGVVGCDC
ncbi:MAG: Unknown protein [uncultured Thiotrichaceae bacterium]|uniref:Porin domain-containing protein n=1 Tax=uncultured Thiotrichaceae bacterium TaxID=298394 RepID=A0A6S6SWC8_9GAMM|nr:MAG: Unknown protein [uncultured Thiotrichaceae bacterium]